MVCYTQELGKRGRGTLTRRTRQWQRSNQDYSCGNGDYTAREARMMA